MHLDVRDLRSFYYRTALGRAAQKAVRDQVRLFWRAAPGQTVVGFGFAVPVLRPFLADARRVIALMPAQQGVMPWPAGRPNVSVLSEETLWPVQSEQADKLILLHGLETSENAAAVLRECYRVTAPEGRALFIVPNRAGLWSSNENTPFGFGRPYSLGQLEAQLKDFDFIPERHAAALFQPPSDRPVWMRTGGLLERAGRSITGRFAGGVLMVEARKQVPAQAGGLRARKRRPVRMLEGLGAPAPEPARRVSPRASEPGRGDCQWAVAGGKTLC